MRIEFVVTLLVLYYSYIIS